MTVATSRRGVHRVAAGSGSGIRGDGAGGGDASGDEVESIQKSLHGIIPHQSSPR